MANYTSSEEVNALHRQLQNTFATGRTKDLAWRRWQLKQCWWMIADNETRIQEALYADLHRHNVENGLEIASVKTDILEHLKHLEEWTASKKIPNAGFIMGYLGRAEIRKEPLGTALILGAWNTPFACVFSPLVAAIAAGCCAVIKPSEIASQSAALVEELIAAYLDPLAIRAATGGVQETSYILNKRWNIIFYTGSTKVGHIIAAAAAKHLTPVVLELGGQGPGIVTKTADIDLAAKRIAWVKFFNAGQVCITANHVFVEPEVADQFLARLSYWAEQFTKTPGGSDGKTGKDQMVRIANDRNFDRLSGLLSKTRGEVVYGESDNSDRASGRLPLTVVNLGPLASPNQPLGDSLMSEELFGPIIPVIVATVPEAVHAINSLPEPLSLYVFSRDRKVVEHVLGNTQSGGVTVNNVIMHVTVGDAPFGGVGASGYGSYHGSYGVAAFSHLRTVVEPPSWIDRLMGFLYPPYVNENAANFDVKNTLGFKKGETLEDQRKAGAFGSVMSVAGQGLGVIALAGLVTAWKFSA